MKDTGSVWNRALRERSKCGRRDGVSPWPDHLRCPPLRRWLPLTLGDAGVVCRVEPPRARWKAPRGLRRVLKDWPEWSADEGCQKLVLVRPLGDPDPLDSALWASLEREVELVELATMPRAGLWDRVRPVNVRLRASAWALRRLQWYATHGGAALQQWVSPDPLDVLVTWMKFSPRYAADHA